MTLVVSHESTEYLNSPSVTPHLETLGDQRVLITQDMREILAVLLLLATVEGNPFLDKWKGQFQPPGHTFLPPGHTFLPPGHSFQPPGPPFPFPGLGLGRHGQQNWYPRPQPGVEFSNAEWVCTNTKTRDMVRHS